MTPSHPLPLHPSWSSPAEYVDSLLSFVTTKDLFRNLCGGVHVLDFLTREPDLYTWVLPPEWRQWFELVDIHDLLQLLLREDLDQFDSVQEQNSTTRQTGWKDYPNPPQTLVQYIHDVRIHSLVRGFQPVSTNIEPLPRHIAVGMKPKKVHEVVNFAAFVDQLSTQLSEETKSPVSVVDFGSGQNYLGRALVCPPYDKHVIAIEQRHHNVEGAKGMDVMAKLAKKQKIMRNKKEYKKQLSLTQDCGTLPTPPPEPLIDNKDNSSRTDIVDQTPVFDSVTQLPLTNNNTPCTDQPDPSNTMKGSITYIEHVLESGHLDPIIHPTQTTKPQSLVVSIHSCGNLTHHGLRSITLNPSVRSVAMIGCCYNLLTERLGPATYKHPQLRSKHPRLEATSSTYDPHGFPMSRRLEEYTYPVTSPSSLSSSPTTTSPDPTIHMERGVRMNITARMMAVQAPYNWGYTDSESYFTRHFFRALLQRILLDRGVVKQALSPSPASPDGNSLSGKDDEGTPLIIGSLRKSAFSSFPEYITAALEKLTVLNPDRAEGEAIAERTRDLLTDPEVVRRYEEKYGYARKNLAVIWSLMAFSAGVVESVIATDRWLWLTEQEEVEQAWVQTVFGYGLSPRNLCVVGVKKRDA